ncbi:MAG: hypothetical protein AABX54_00300 [Nanoarchaeota archaeon]
MTMNKKAQEQSAHWTLQWFMQNIVIWIILIFIISFGVYFLLNWIKGF